MDETTIPIPEDSVPVPENSVPAPEDTEPITEETLVEDPTVESADPSAPEADTAPSEDPTEFPTYGIPEDEFSEYIPEETIEVITEPTDPPYIQAIQSAAADISHASLFGSFLICGTLVGLMLLRGRYGT